MLVYKHVSVNLVIPIRYSLPVRIALYHVTPINPGELTAGAYVFSYHLEWVDQSTHTKALLYNSDLFGTLTVSQV